MKEILLVDDEPDVLNLLKEILENLGFSVRVADNGSDALKSLSEKTPDLVILDIMMEPMSGWEVLSLIRNNIQIKNVPVIVLTGKMPLPNEILSYEELLNGFAMKPLRMEEFKRLVFGFFDDKKLIEARCEKALESGANKETVDEYARISNNVRVLGEMLDCLYRVMEADSSAGDREELSGITGLLDTRKKRLSELETII